MIAFTKQVFLQALDEENLYIIERFIQHDKHFLKMYCGMEPFQQLKLGLHPLAYTIFHNKVKAAQCLIQNGADCTIKYKFPDGTMLTTTYSLLTIALLLRRTEIAQMLLPQISNSKHATHYLDDAVDISLKNGLYSLFDSCILHGATIPKIKNYSTHMKEIIENAILKKQAFKLGKMLALLCHTTTGINEIYHTIGNTHPYVGMAYQAFIHKTSHDIPMHPPTTKRSLTKKMIDNLKNLKL